MVQEVIDFKDIPDADLIKLFEKYYNEQYVIDQTDRHWQDINYLKQRRLIITPTVDYYQIQVEDETCLAIRKFKD